MVDKRRLGHCDECGDENVKMATAHICYRCYMRQRREAEDINVHTGSVRKEHVKLWSAHAKLMSVFQALRVGEDDVAIIKTTLRPYLKLIGHQLNWDGSPPVLTLPDETTERDERLGIQSKSATEPGEPNPIESAEEVPNKTDEPPEFTSDGKRENWELDALAKAKTARAEARRIKRSSKKKA